MIRTVIWISFLTLVRDRMALVLSFVLPLIFFSVFAEVFGGLDDSESRQVRTLIYFEEDSEKNSRLRELLTANSPLQLVNLQAADPLEGRQKIREEVGNGSADIGIIITKGFSEKLGNPTKGLPEIVAINNNTNPLALPTVQGMLQAASLSLVIEGLTPFSENSDNYAELKSLFLLNEEATVNNPGDRPSVAFFAAGLGVMFLLFSVSGRSATLIEERENGVLMRLLASGMSLNQLILGHWLYLTLLGIVQVSIMFIWAAVVFGLDLWSPYHLVGFVCMTTTTASAAAALGVFLAVSCRSRIQLNGVASVLILVMSALGGSMFPRFLMSDTMRELGRFTFNAWAIDGYQKVFWYRAMPIDLMKEMTVLAVCCILLLLSASRIAKIGIERHLD